jgi:hypothetical protein
MEFFLFRCYISTKICSNVTDEMSGKITLQKKYCYDASIVLKIAPMSPARSISEQSFLRRTFFATMKQKRDFFAS